MIPNLGHTLWELARWAVASANLLAFGRAMPCFVPTYAENIVIISEANNYCEI